MRWATRTENEHDKRANGTTNGGVRAAKARFTEDEVLMIRKDHRPQKELAVLYGVSASNISYIKAGKTWKTQSPESETTRTTT